MATKQAIESTHVEEAIIATLLQNNDLLGELILKPYMFSDYQYKNFIEHVLEVGRINANELYMKALSDETFISKDDISRLYHEEFISRHHFKQYQIEILAAYQQRKSTELVSEYLNDRTIKNLMRVVDELNDVKALTVTREDKTGAFVRNVYTDIIEGTTANLVTTGYEGLDFKVLGFEAGQFNIIAARPSVGKTGFAINMMLNIARKGYTTSFFSLETNGEGIIRRAASNISGIDLELLKTSDRMTNEESEKVLKTLGYIDTLSINISDDTGITPQDIRAEAMRFRNTNHIIFIDYLQLMESEKKYDSRQTEVSAISRQLKKIALETGCVIIALSQLSRGVEQRQNKRPMLSDLRESGSIEQDANIVFMLYREDYYEMDEVVQDDNVSEVECNVVKNRDGSTGVVKFEYYKKTQRFYT